MRTIFLWFWKEISSRRTKFDDFFNYFFYYLFFFFFLALQESDDYDIKNCESAFYAKNRDSNPPRITYILFERYFLRRQ